MLAEGPAVLGRVAATRKRLRVSHALLAMINSRTKSNDVAAKPHLHGAKKLPANAGVFCLLSIRNKRLRLDRRSSSGTSFDAVVLAHEF